MTRPKPLVLLVLDGWGYSTATEHNAIYTAKKPNWDYFWKNYPHMLLSGSGTDVGLPDKQMGNSEVGHMNLGAGRVIHQDLGRINKSIETGLFFENSVLVKACEDLAHTNKALHVIGLLSSGGVHSNEKHIFALLELAEKYKVSQVYVHVFLDGRDTPPRSAKASLTALQELCDRLGNVKIASIIGRYYAMDRDKRWDRTKAAYDLVVQGSGEFSSPTAMAALDAAYARDENDEFIKPTVIGTPVKIQKGDAVVFMNFRSDRARQLTRVFVDKSFKDFTPDYVPNLSHFVSLTEYAKDLPTEIAFPPHLPNNTFGEYIASCGLTQLRIAETEKYAHVTFFFSGGREEPFEGEERKLIPSPKVATYDLQPEMSAPLLTEELVKAIERRQYDIIIGNYANPDMIGHTGDFDATVKAIEALDKCLGKVYAALQEVGGEAFITADHGNAEKMFDSKTKQAHTAHTSELVPLIYLGRHGKFGENDTGVLADIAPTLLKILDLPIPAEMTGRVLLDND